MKKLIKERHLIPLGVWFVVYMGLFLYLEVFEPDQVHLIVCGLDRRIPYLPVFVYPYLSWFPYIIAVSFLAVRNLTGPEYRKAVLILITGMNLFLLISYVWPTGLDLREGIVYDTTALSGRLVQLVQTVDTPKSVFPSMHVYVTLVLQDTLEMQRKRLPAVFLWTGRAFAAAIILSTMFTKQHSVLDVLAAVLLFAALTGAWYMVGERLGAGKTYETVL